MSACQSAQGQMQQQMPGEAVKTMANGLPEKDSVRWASASAKKVANPAHAADMNAIHAADAWAANPTPETQQAAAAAAAKTDFDTPGAWAAQGAAWAGSGSGLTAHAVSGAVMLAAAQGGKPIAPPKPKTPSLAAPSVQAPKLQMPQAPQTPQFAKPEVPAPGAVKGPDGLTLTPPQRAEMTKNTAPFIQLGCDIEAGKA